MAIKVRGPAVAKPPGPNATVATDIYGVFAKSREKQMAESMKDALAKMEREDVAYAAQVKLVQDQTKLVASEIEHLQTVRSNMEKDFAKRSDSVNEFNARSTNTVNIHNSTKQLEAQKKTATVPGTKAAVGGGKLDRELGVSDDMTSVIGQSRQVGTVGDRGETWDRLYNIQQTAGAGGYVLPVDQQGSQALYGKTLDGTINELIANNVEPNLAREIAINDIPDNMRDDAIAGLNTREQFKGGTTSGYRVDLEREYKDVDATLLDKPTALDMQAIDDRLAELYAKDLSLPDKPDSDRIEMARDEFQAHYGSGKPVRYQNKRGTEALLNYIKSSEEQAFNQLLLNNPEPTQADIDRVTSAARADAVQEIKNRASGTRVSNVTYRAVDPLDGSSISYMNNGNIVFSEPGQEDDIVKPGDDDYGYQKRVLDSVRSGDSLPSHKGPDKRAGPGLEPAVEEVEEAPVTEPTTSQADAGRLQVAQFAEEAASQAEGGRLQAAQFAEEAALKDEEATIQVEDNRMSEMSAERARVDEEVLRGMERERALELAILNDEPMPTPVQVSKPPATEESREEFDRRIARQLREDGPAVELERPQGFSTTFEDPPGVQEYIDSQANPPAPEEPVMQIKPAAPAPSARDIELEMLEMPASELAPAPIVLPKKQTPKSMIDKDAINKIEAAAGATQMMLNESEIERELATPYGKIVSQLVALDSTNDPEYVISRIAEAYDDDFDVAKKATTLAFVLMNQKQAQTKLVE